ncbi:hypothetical protein [Rhizobium lusitanum]|uniref:hypothetical protein n=1 Tax=Rhizobium lusitanum TaxID=293958 RepID=UPI000A7D1CAA|nr:hypothetical protein [Rhizobium lusitanum]
MRIAAFDEGWVRHVRWKTVSVSEHAQKNDRRALHDVPAKLNQLAGMAVLR